MKFWACVLAMMVPGIVMADIASTTYTDKALSSKADDGTVVHTRGDELIGGTKTFVDPIVSISTAPFRAPGTNLRSSDENVSLNMYGSKGNTLYMGTENSNSVSLSANEKVALTMLEKGNPTIELTTKAAGYEGSALIMQDEISNRIQMGGGYTSGASLSMVGEYTDLALETESASVAVYADVNAATLSMNNPNSGIRFAIAQAVDPTLWFAKNGKSATISFGSGYINLDQHLKAPNATIDGGLTIGKHIRLITEVPSDLDNNIVPDTQWVNDRIEDARGVIPVGGADGKETAQIWIE